LQTSELVAESEVLGDELSAVSEDGTDDGRGQPRLAKHLSDGTVVTVEGLNGKYGHLAKKDEGQRKYLESQGRSPSWRALRGATRVVETADNEAQQSPTSRRRSEHQPASAAIPLMLDNVSATDLLGDFWRLNNELRLNRRRTESRSLART
jgi:hypothetical protein